LNWVLAFALRVILAACLLTGAFVALPVPCVRAQSVIDGFNPGADSAVRALVVQPGGKIVVGGLFTMLGGQTRNYIGRLDPDGSLDSAFNPGANERVVSLALQLDGKIVVGGWFTTLGGRTRERIARLNADGSLDATFNPGANEKVFALALQADDKVVVGGKFTTLGGQSRNYLARLSCATAALQHLVIDPGGTTITWMRSGAGPEVEYVIFEVWIEGGLAFIPLGTGTRIDGGWQLSGLPLTLPRQHNL
jgi:uncharacterized delta-60 repeat protein